MSRRLAAPLFLLACLASSPIAAQEAPSAAAPAPLAAARAAYDRGDWDAAIAAYTEADKDARLAGPVRARVSLELASILWERGSYAEAAPIAERALAAARRERLDDLVGPLLVTVGQIEVARGRLAEAASTFKVCAASAAEVGDAVFGPICRINLSNVDALRGAESVSGAQIERDIAALSRAPSDAVTAFALAKTGEGLAHRGEIDRALQLLEQAQARFRAAHSVPGQARNRLRIARALQAGERWAKARAHIKEARPFFVRMKNRPALAEIEGMFGRDAEAAGRDEEARAHYTAALKRARALGSPALIARGALALCELEARARPSSAGAHCARAQKGFEAIGARALASRARVAEAMIAQRARDWDRARRLYRAALSAPGLGGAPEAMARANLCLVEAEMGATGALMTCTEALSVLDAADPSSFGPQIAATAYASARAARAEKRDEEAASLYERAARSWAVLSEPHYMRAAEAMLRRGALLAARASRRTEAEAAFVAGQAWIERAPDEPAARAVRAQLGQQRAQLLAELGRWDEARRQADELADWAAARQMHGEEADALQVAAIARHKVGDRAGAVSVLERGIEAAERAGDRGALAKKMRADRAKIADR